ncbi:MAG: alpha/beta hydrolase [Bacteroidota bacterium]
MTTTLECAEIMRKPSLFWLSTEIGRAITEFGFSYPFRAFSTPKMTGDGHPVLVLPGFMASDKSTKVLRGFIQKCGYEAVAWDLGRNRGEVETLDLLFLKIEEIYETYGRKISIVGWSLGGVLARQLAKGKPHLIRQVVTLGSPFRDLTAPNNASWLYNLISGGKRVVDLDPDLLADIPKPAPVPTTAIYSKEDGVVSWKVCIEEEETPIHQNIQVWGSHIGLGVNTAVLKIIADRLQYSLEDWRPFKPYSKVEDLLLYPSL